MQEGTRPTDVDSVCLDDRFGFHVSIEMAAGPSNYGPSVEPNVDTPFSDLGRATSPGLNYCDKRDEIIGRLTVTNAEQEEKILRLEEELRQGKAERRNDLAAYRKKKNLLEVKEEELSTRHKEVEQLRQLNEEINGQNAEIKASNDRLLNELQDSLAGREELQRILEENNTKIDEAERAREATLTEVAAKQERFKNVCHELGKFFLAVSSDPQLQILDKIPDIVTAPSFEASVSALTILHGSQTDGEMVNTFAKIEPLTPSPASQSESKPNKFECVVCHFRFPSKKELFFHLDERGHRTAWISRPRKRALSPPPNGIDRYNPASIRDRGSPPVRDPRRQRIEGK